MHRHQDTEHQVARYGGDRVPIGHLQQRLAFPSQRAANQEKQQRQQQVGGGHCFDYLACAAALDCNCCLLVSWLSGLGALRSTPGAELDEDDGADDMTLDSCGYSHSFLVTRALSRCVTRRRLPKCQYRAGKLAPVSSCRVGWLVRACQLGARVPFEDESAAPGIGIGPMQRAQRRLAAKKGTTSE